jgi:hypothetical protein
MNQTLVLQYLIDKLPAIIGALAAAYSVIKVHKLHILVNSRLTELLKTTGDAARAEGNAAGRIEGKAEKK